ncbi:MAG TPA: ammonium transporter [Mycobacteriales bacterium]|jgi:Amt family ammonium transporter|nr:ammonium transporter [Mycobacteriales bacterium]
MIHLAAAPPAINAGDTAWILASSALVLLMTPGLAFFYGGMVRGKNVLGMLMQNYVAIGVVGVLWVLFGFTLAFSDNGFGGFAGNFHQFGLAHMKGQVVGTIPLLAFVGFQAMFAIITPALITGSTADRFKFPAFIIFIAVWVTVVYAPVAHWVWNSGGWLFQRGAEDFAGGTVVHANAGAAGVAMALLLGRRKGWPNERMRPHNVPYVLLGAGLLWFGWFGFNAGSALAANETASYAFLNTNTATAAALLGWIIVERLRDGHATTLGAASGAVAGLVAITPACGFISPVGSIFLGLIAGVVCSLCTTIKFKLGLDDALDVGAVHLVGGVLGALLIGFFGTSTVGGADGIFYGGGAHLLRVQAEAVGAAVGYSFVATMIIGLILKYTIGIRMSDEQQMVGMDESLHAESAYDFNALSAGSFSGTSFGSSSLVLSSSTLGHRTEVQA